MSCLSTVQFYGHEKNMDNSLPIKTDKDTLREGYRSEPCAVNMCLCFFVKLTKASPIFFFYYAKDSFFLRRMTWIQLGRRGWSNVTMTSFLKSILFW